MLSQLWPSLHPPGVGVRLHTSLTYPSTHITSRGHTIQSSTYHLLTAYYRSRYEFWIATIVAEHQSAFKATEINACWYKWNKVCIACWLWWWLGGSRGPVPSGEREAAVVVVWCLLESPFTSHRLSTNGFLDRLCFSMWLMFFDVPDELGLRDCQAIICLDTVSG